MLWPSYHPRITRTVSGLWGRGRDGGEHVGAELSHLLLVHPLHGHRLHEADTLGRGGWGAEGMCLIQDSLGITQPAARTQALPQWQEKTHMSTKKTDILRHVHSDAFKPRKALWDVVAGGKALAISLEK